MQYMSVIIYKKEMRLINTKPIYSLKKSIINILEILDTLKVCARGVLSCNNQEKINIQISALPS